MTVRNCVALPGLDKPKPNGYTDRGTAVDELRDLCITGPGLHTHTHTHTHTTNTHTHTHICNIARSPRLSASVLATSTRTHTLTAPSPLSHTQVPATLTAAAQLDSEPRIQVCHICDSSLICQSILFAKIDWQILQIACQKRGWG